MQRGWIIVVFLFALVGCQNSNPCKDLLRENFELNEWILEQEIHIDQQSREIKRLEALADARENFEEQSDEIEPPAIDFGGDGGGAPAFPRPGDPGNPLDDEVPAPPFTPNRIPGDDLPNSPPVGGAINDLEMILPGLNGRPGSPVDSINDVESITIDPRRTRAYNLDGSPGDDGLVVVFEPRDAESRPLAALGDISIVAVDPALPEHLARVARWDYKADEVRDLLVQTRQGPKVVCQLLWPQVPPESSRLQLYVRMKSPDGASHEADMPLLADFAGVDRDSARFARAVTDRDPRRTPNESTTNENPSRENASQNGRSFGDYERASSDRTTDGAIDRNSTSDTNSAPPEYRPLRRVTLPGEEQPPTAADDREPIRTSQRTPPPWSPVRR